jgi:site-specific recombinase XerD
MFRRNLKACGFDERFITPHALRHTAALFYLESGGTLESTKRLLRHEQLSQTKVYETYLLRLHNDAEEKIETLLNEEIM